MKNLTNNELEAYESVVFRFVSLTKQITASEALQLISDAAEKDESYNPYGVYPREEYEDFTWTGIKNKIISAAEKELSKNSNLSLEDHVETTSN